MTKDGYVKNYCSNSWFLVWRIAAFQRAGLRESRKGRDAIVQKSETQMHNYLRLALLQKILIWPFSKCLEFSQVKILFRPKALSLKCTYTWQVVSYYILVSIVLITFFLIQIKFKKYFNHVNHFKVFRSVVLQCYATSVTIFRTFSSFSTPRFLNTWLQWGH